MGNGNKKVNSRDRRIIIILAVGIALAAVAAFCVYTYLTPQKTAVYIFNDDYKAGETLTADKLTTVTCDANILVAGGQTSTSDVFVTAQDIGYILSTGDSLRIDVTQGMPLMSSMLSVNGGSSIEMAMDPSKVAVSIQMSDIRGVSSELKEGSKVNIYFTGGDTAGTTLLFQGMRVLSVARDSNGSIEAVTIECTTDESLKLIYASEYGSLYLGLIDSTGYQHVEGEPSYAPTDSLD